MIELKASEIAEIVGGRLVGGDVLVTGAPAFNSNDVTVGSIFLAFQGEKLDGHNFIDEAFARGAVLALVTNESKKRCIVVNDVTLALSKLAQQVRKNLPNLTVVGITGSQGKTTAKDLLFNILKTTGNTVASTGNFNNEIGAPITLLRCDSRTKFCILEMGARHLGDIANLALITSPDVGVVLKVGSAHLGEFGSPAAIAQAKSEMISSLDPSGIAILGLYDAFTPEMKSLHNGKVLTFGETTGAVIRATDIDIREGRPHFDLITPSGRAAVGLRVIGAHQVANALAAAAVATALDISIDVIASGLSTAELKSPWRMQVVDLENLLLINDSYNASPESMAAALQTLTLFAQEQGGQSWAFIGKMNELGASSSSMHAATGTLASELGIDHLVCIAADDFAAAIGPSSQTQVHLFAKKEDALKVLTEVCAGDVILVKASRSEKFEEIALAIEDYWRTKTNNESEGAN